MSFDIFNFNFSEFQQLRNKYAIYILCCAFVTISPCTWHKNKANNRPTQANMPTISLLVQQSCGSNPPYHFVIASCELDREHGMSAMNSTRRKQGVLPHDLNPHTPKWTLTLWVGVLMEFRIFRERLQEWKPIGLKKKIISLECFWNVHV